MYNEQIEWCLKRKAIALKEERYSDAADYDEMATMWKGKRYGLINN